MQPRSSPRQKLPRLAGSGAKLGVVPIQRRVTYKPDKAPRCRRHYEYTDLVPREAAEFYVDYERHVGAPLKEGVLRGHEHEYVCEVAKRGGANAVTNAKCALLLVIRSLRWLASYTP